MAASCFLELRRIPCAQLSLPHIGVARADLARVAKGKISTNVSSEKREEEKSTKDNAFAKSKRGSSSIGSEAADAKALDELGKICALISQIVFRQNSFTHASIQIAALTYAAYSAVADRVGLDWMTVEQNLGGSSILAGKLCKAMLEKNENIAGGLVNLMTLATQGLLVEMTNICWPAVALPPTTAFWSAGIPAHVFTRLGGANVRNFANAARILGWLDIVERVPDTICLGMAGVKGNLSSTCNRSRLCSDIASFRLSALMHKSFWIATLKSRDGH